MDYIIYKYINIYNIICVSLLISMSGQSGSKKPLPNGCFISQTVTCSLRSRSASFCGAAWDSPWTKASLFDVKLLRHLPKIKKKETTGFRKIITVFQCIQEFMPKIHGSKIQKKNVLYVLEFEWTSTPNLCLQWDDLDHSLKIQTSSLMLFFFSQFLFWEVIEHNSSLLTCTNHDTSGLWRLRLQLLSVACCFCKSEFTICLAYKKRKCLISIAYIVSLKDFLWLFVSFSEISFLCLKHLETYMFHHLLKISFVEAEMFKPQNRQTATGSNGSLESFFCWKRPPRFHLGLIFSAVNLLGWLKRSKKYLKTNTNHLKNANNTKPISNQHNITGIWTHNNLVSLCQQQLHM